MTSRDDETTEASLEPAGSSLSAETIIGRKVGKYTVLQNIARGGTATVYKAHDTVLNREVAFKILHDHLEQKREVVERFQNEARVVASLRHPNVLNIFDFFEYEGRAVLVAEFMPGITLSELLKQCRKLPEKYVLMLGHEMLQGLRAAHDKGITHRDIKPANILLHADIGVKLSDFGLAKLIDSDDGLTKEGVFIGTPSFSSPEQIEGREIDHRSDLFSLGLTLYMLATGKHAFKQKGDSTTTVWFKIVRGSFQAVREIDQNISPDLEKLLDRSLQVDRDKRFQSAKEMADAIRSLLVKQKAYPYEDELRQYLRKPFGLEVGKAIGRKRRKRGRYFVAAACLLMAVTLGLLWWNQNQNLPDEIEPVVSDTEEPTELTPTPNEEVQPSSQPKDEPKLEAPRVPTKKPPPPRQAAPAKPVAVNGLGSLPSVNLSSKSRIVLASNDQGFALRFPFQGEKKFVLSQSSQFKNPIIEGLFRSGGVDWSNWSEGVYYWKAGSDFGEVEITNFERWEASERITKRTADVIPSRGVYDLQLNPWREEIVLDWRSIQGGQNFEVQLARDELFEDVFKKETTSRKIYPVEYNWQKSQKLFWKVLFLDDFNNTVNDIGRQELILRLSGYAPRFVLVYPRPFQAVSSDKIQFFAGLPRSSKLECRTFDQSQQSQWQALKVEHQSVVFDEFEIGSSSRILCRLEEKGIQKLFAIPLRRN